MGVTHTEGLSLPDQLMYIGGSGLTIGFYFSLSNNMTFVTGRAVGGLLHLIQSLLQFFPLGLDSLVIN